MVKTYTNRGKAWELVNSWWVLLTLVPFGVVSYIPFLYIGLRVKNQRWRIYGFVYLVIFIAALLTTAAGVGAAIAISLWVITLIHAFKIRPAYLIQLDVYKANEKVSDQKMILKLRQEAEAKFSFPNIETQPPNPKISDYIEERGRNQGVAPPVSKIDSFVEKIDVNTASESDLAAIPQIGIILAKKIVMKRRETGKFQSFEHFKSAVGLSGHALESMEGLFLFQQEEPQQPTKTGRRVDF